MIGGPPETVEVLIEGGLGRLDMAGGVTFVGGHGGDVHRLELL